jgi:hypothetical protein
MGSPRLIVHLLDGTYELFRHFYGLRRFRKDGDPPFGAVIGVMNTALEMIEKGATHLGVATDHVIESFRNRLWPGYKTGEGIDPVLFAQFHPLEEGLAAMGITVWPMIDLEADDALASAARMASESAAVEKVCIWTPDKDLAQSVRGDRVVQVDRRSGKIRDESGVREKFGVEPALIPDYLALVGDSADGYPGIAGLGSGHGGAAVEPIWTHRSLPARGAGRASRPGALLQESGHTTHRRRIGGINGRCRHNLRSRTRRHFSLYRPIRRPDYVFAFHDQDEIGPRMLARIAGATGLTPDDL